jgi:hypothetical protein
MCKSQYRNKRTMKKQGNMTPPKGHNSLATDAKTIEVNEMPDK